jgi:hypothetical protein
VQSSVDKQQVLIGAGFTMDVATEVMEPFSEAGIFEVRVDTWLGDGRM